jgi:hypothetical protein
MTRHELFGYRSWNAAVQYHYEYQYCAVVSFTVRPVVGLSVIQLKALCVSRFGGISLYANLVSMSVPRCFCEFFVFEVFG